MAQVLSFLQGFSDNFKAALLLWPFLSFLLTFPILAYLYHRDGRLRWGSALAAYVSVLYLAGLGCFTLYPLPSGTEGPGITYGIPPQLNPLNFIADIQRDGATAVFQLLFNVVLFLPLGFIAQHFLRLGLIPTFFLSLAVTLLIETAQLTGLFGIYPFAYRTFEVDDIITNTLGGVLGWFVGRLIDRAGFSEQEQEVSLCRQPGFIRRCVSLWIDCMIMAPAFMVLSVLLSLGINLMFSDVMRTAGLEPIQVSGVIAVACFVVILVAVEGVFPWTHEGSTPGGLFTHMTVEPADRSTIRRVFFYVLRLLVLGMTILFPLFMFVVLGLFYLVTRHMPYDYVLLH